MRKARPGPVPIADLAGEVLDPLLRKRAGLSMALVQSWEEIVGPAVAAVSRPEKVVWPRRAHEDDPFQPATLTVAASGLSAMRIQHETSEIIGRINAFMGFAAIGRIRIVQKPLPVAASGRPKLAPLSAARGEAIDREVGSIEDEGLRQALARLGRSVAARGPR